MFVPPIIPMALQLYQRLFSTVITLGPPDTFHPQLDGKENVLLYALMMHVAVPKHPNTPSLCLQVVEVPPAEQ